MANALERLVAAAEYPEAVPPGARSFTLQADGGDIFAEETGGRLRLSRKLSSDPVDWPALAACAPGRMLREEATPAVGPLPGDTSGTPACFLWQDVPADADGRLLARTLETFLDSCDWWRDRLAAGSSSPSAEADPPSMIIRP